MWPLQYLSPFLRAHWQSWNPIILSLLTELYTRDATIYKATRVSGDIQHRMWRTAKSDQPVHGHEANHKNTLPFVFFKKRICIVDLLISR